MNIALVLTPCWITDNPPGSLALIAAFLKESGHFVKCYDFNIDFYNLVKQRDTKEKFNLDKKNDSGEEINNLSWRNDKNAIWENKNQVYRIISKFNEEIDSYVKKIIDSNPVIVGFTIYKISLFFSIEIAERLKSIKPDIKIIFGGPACFPHSIGDLLFHYSNAIDYICFGEGEIALKNLIDSMNNNISNEEISGLIFRKNNESIKGKPIPFIQDLDKLPFADFSDFDLRIYTERSLTITTSRGCINRCSFCNESPFWKKFRQRDARFVFNEMLAIKNKYPEVEHIWFTDSLINGNISFLEDLCNLLIIDPLGIKWTASAYIRKEMDTDLFQLMKRAGCNALLFGLESASNDVLKYMNKGYNVQIAKKTLLESVRAGINTYSNIIVGHPGETNSNYNETVRFLLFFLNKNNIKNTTFNKCSLLNGSILKKELKKYNISNGFIDSWYSNDGKINKNIRELRLRAIENLSLFSHYQNENMAPIIKFILRVKLNFNPLWIFYLVKFELYLRIRSFLYSLKFKKEINNFFYGDNKSIKKNSKKKISNIQEWKMRLISKKMIIFVKNSKRINEFELVEYDNMFKLSLSNILEYFDSDDVNRVLDGLFPMSGKQLFENLGNIDKNNIELKALLIKSQIA